MKTSEEIDFEQFCQKNGVKPTNMKADYYLAGYFKGQERMIENVCKWLGENSDRYARSSLTDIQRYLWVDAHIIEDVRKAMEKKE